MSLSGSLQRPVLPNRLTKIEKLDKDILWHLFRIIAAEIPDSQNPFYEDGPRPLDDIWTASQVCSLWRAILLESTAIWGMLIDISILRKANPKMARTVLNRSGGSPLWVYGAIDKAGPSNSLVFQVLSCGRVEKVFLYVCIQEKRLIPRVWRKIFLNAAVLKKAQVKDWDVHAWNFSYVYSTPTMSYKPWQSMTTLLSLEVSQYPGIWGLEPPRLPFLRHLTLTNSMSHSSLHALLSFTPRLERLDLRGPITHNDHPTSELHLPYLNNLSILGYLQDLAPVVSWLKNIPTLAVLNVCIKQPTKDFQQQTSTLNTITEWFKKHIRKYNPRHMDASISPHLAMLCTYMSPVMERNHARYAPAEYATIFMYQKHSVPSRPNSFPMQEFLSLADISYLSGFRSIRFGDDPSLVDSNTVKPYYPESLRPFFQSLNAVSKLGISTCGLHHLVELFGKETASLFPEMTELHLDCMSCSHQRQQSDAGGEFATYLMGRRGLGRPLSELSIHLSSHLPCCHEVESVVRDALPEDGLNIRRQIGEWELQSYGRYYAGRYTDFWAGTPLYY